MHPDGGPAQAVADAKDRLRRRLLDGRRALSADQLTTARHAVASHVLAQLRPSDAVVAAYVPLRTEPGSLDLLAALAASGREVIVPVMLPDRDLSWVRWSADAAAASPPLGVRAIGRADLVLVPALAVSPVDGARLGRGGGSYDRALRRARGRTIALLHAGELLETVPADAHDVPVDAAVTPAGRVEVEARGGPPR